MNILWVVIVGFIVGLIARALMPGKDNQGYILTTVLGIGGALFGTFIGQIMGLYNEGEPAGLIMSVVGALIVLFAYNKLSNKSVVKLS